jgi:hypothetical protein
VPGARVERACPAFQTGALTATASLANLVEEEGIEPSFAGCGPAVLPLNDSPKNWLRAGELNATRMAYEARMTPVHLPAENLVREAGVEPAASRLSIECSNHAELFPDGAPCQTRTGFSGLQVRRIAIYAYRACDSGANGANRTLIGRLPCDCSPTELHRLEPEGIFETPTSALRERRSST